VWASKEAASKTEPAEKAWFDEMDDLGMTTMITTMVVVGDDDEDEADDDDDDDDDDVGRRRHSQLSFVSSLVDVSSVLISCPPAWATIT
jgi:hypothetical protein